MAQAFSPLGCGEAAEDAAALDLRQIDVPRAGQELSVGVGQQGDNWPGRGVQVLQAGMRGYHNAQRAVGQLHRRADRVKG